MKVLVRIAVSIVFVLSVMAFVIPQASYVSIESTSEKHACSAENSVFQAGEEVTYVIYYNWKLVWIPAGEVVFKVDEDGELYHFVAKGYTYPSYEWFYKVDDRYETYATKDELKSVRAIRDVQEGKYEKYSELHFDREKDSVLYRQGEGPGQIVKEQSLPIHECMQDVLSLMYITRNMDYDNFRKGDDIPVYLMLDDDDYDVKFTYRGKQKKKIKKLGKFRTIEISPTLIQSNLFNEGDQMTIYASDDRNRLPLLIESPVSVGSIKAVLKSAKGLKYPMEAQLN